MQFLLDNNGLVTAFLVTYTVVVLLVCVYGMHRYQLVHLYYKYRRNTPRIKACFVEYPVVTIQLPMYNERAVARRIIDATCAIDYPRDRLQIQVLDDSTDDTVEIAAQAVREWQARGFDIEYVHRTNREGYKAGALANGLKTAKGEFILIFDADFLPPPNILHETIDYFTDEKVGMVQARWEHLNRDQSLLTRTQAILLDGHFVIEHAARNRSGRFMSFNGTAGMWRRSCIEDAGGWQHDTLTEDLDLSYRAQMKGWKFVYLPELTSAAELPPDMEAFKQQQYRWAKGGAQTCKKLLPTILRSKLPARIKMEAFFHLTSCTVYLYVVILTFLLYPVLYLKLHLFQEGLVRYLFDASLLLVATCSAGTFYVASQRVLFRTWSDSLKYVPFLMSLGVGIAFNNTLAVLTGFFGKPGEFVRTPKFGVTDRNRTWRKQSGQRKIKWQPFAELAIGLYLMSCLVLCIVEQKITVGLPFLCLFMAGYLYVPLTTWFGHAFANSRSETETVEELAPAPVTCAQPPALRRGARRGPRPGPLLPLHPSTRANESRSVHN
ncbi:MAG TPA: glycosyltransferase family 2 protein [Phycisphaerae bacterium]|nr:glycosyltransferase family 2 protein [Phycisphaerae bacterium]